MLYMTVLCEINNTFEMRAKLSLLECKLSEAIARRAAGGGGQAAADQVPVCWRVWISKVGPCVQRDRCTQLTMFTQRQVYTADHVYTETCVHS